MHVFYIKHRKRSAEDGLAEILISSAGAKRLKAASQNLGQQS